LIIYENLQRVEDDPETTVVQRAPIYFRAEAPLSGMDCSCGTCRMGSDPASSMVSFEGRCHGLANPWIADANVFPGWPAVGPGLTVVANALRIGEAIGGVLGLVVLS
jgi:choline dehydrogenase-like flavoprotein